MIPTIPGVPWWGAVLMAVTFTAIGFAFDAGSGAKELTLAFAAAYAVGCIAAVLAVRQTGIFTAVIQPPLILFVAVPGAYFLFHGGDDGRHQGHADQLRLSPDRALPADVLHLGDRAAGRPGPLVHGDVDSAVARPPKPPSRSEGRLSAVTAKISGLLARDGDDEDIEETPAAAADQAAFDRPQRKDGQAGRGEPRRTRERRPTKRTRAVTLAARPPAGDRDHRARAERPRRPRPSRQQHRPARFRRPSRAAGTRIVVDAIVGARNPASSSRRRASGGPPYQRPDRHDAGSTASSPSNRPRHERLQRHRVQRKQPPPGLAGAVPRGRRRRAASAVPGPATRRQASGRCLGVRRLEGSSARAARISRGSANTSVSLAVVTGCTVP